MEVPLEDAADAGEGAPDASAGALAGYYDRLSRWTASAHRVGYGGGHDKLTVHRALADPRAGGRPTFTRLHDVLLSTLPAPPSGHVLDAGCGLGGTMLDLARRCSARFTGVTLSEQQAAVGRAASAKTGLADRIAIEVGSYDSPPPGPFDLAIAIESLAHSPHPEKSIGAIVARLAPGGRLAIVDDMPEPQARGSRDLAWFQSGWQAPVLPGAAELKAILARHGLVIVADRDLTGELQQRTLARIAQLEKLNRVLRRFAPSGGLRELLDSYRGGLSLERLYRFALMRYRLIVAEKRSPASEG
ncbi:MAG TPA: methyltransferase domain-containing protein [Gammaproteobacteria bacterium]|nr:methyltransferase domain-containing protein [Gammaproteobacteria bacterium]